MGGGKMAVCVRCGNPIRPGAVRVGKTDWLCEKCANEYDMVDWDPESTEI